MASLSRGARADESADRYEDERRRTPVAGLAAVVGVAVAVSVASVALALLSLGPEPPEGLLFDGTRQSAWRFTQAASPDRIAEVPDPAGSSQTALRITARNEDVEPLVPDVNPLAVLLGPRAQMEPGGEYWQSFELRLPSDGFPPRIPDGDWVLLQSPVFGAPFEGSPPLSLRAREGQLRFESNEHAPKPLETVWSMPIVRDRWLRFTWHFKFADDGWVELFVDGRSARLRDPGGTLERRLEIATIDRAIDEGPWTPRIGASYKRGMTDALTVYYRNFRLGTTRHAVEA